MFQEHLLRFLKWAQNVLTRAIVALEAREKVVFSLLIRRGTHHKELKEHLQNAGIIVGEPSPHSDYIKGEASIEDFSVLFAGRLRWKSMLAGSWEIQNNKAEIPEEISALGVKLVLLHRDLLLPFGFIKRHTIP